MASAGFVAKCDGRCATTPVASGIFLFFFNNVFVQQSFLSLYPHTYSSARNRLNLDVDISRKLSGLNTRPGRLGCGQKLWGKLKSGCLEHTHSDSPGGYYTPARTPHSLPRSYPCP